MQSTGQTSTQALSLTSMHGSAMTYDIRLSLRPQPAPALGDSRGLGPFRGAHVLPLLPHEEPWHMIHVTLGQTEADFESPVEPPGGHPRVFRHLARPIPHDRV